jgi:hypothetical protein
MLRGVRVEMMRAPSSAHSRDEKRLVDEVIHLSCILVAKEERFSEK